MFIDARGNLVVKGELFFKLVADNEISTITPKLTHHGRGEEGEIQTYQIEEVTLNLYKTESKIKNLSLLFRFPSEKENRQIDDIEPYSDLYNKPIDKKLYLIHENKTDGSSIIDSVGNIILSDFYYVIFLKKENGIYYFKVARYGMYTEPSFGIANSKGEFLYEPVFDLLNMDVSTVECSNNELAMFKYKNHYGLMNCNFEVIAEAKYESIHILNKTLALVKLSDRHWEFLNLKTNQETVLNIQEIKGVTEDFYGYYGNTIPIKIKDKWGFANRNGSIIIQPKYSFVTLFNEGLSFVVTQAYIPNQMLPESNGYIINETGIVVAPLSKELLKDISQVDVFSQGFLKFKSRKTNQFGFINKKGQIVIQPVFEEASSFTDGKAEVKRYGTTYSIDKEGNRINE
jgi:hypothetical protein